jgi:exodeoxyribonuclease-5
MCGYNATRVKLNQAIRGYRDIASPAPVSGDYVVCLRNNRARHIYNGMIGQVTHIAPASGEAGELWYEAEMALEGEDFHYRGYVWRAQFGALVTASDIPLAPDGERGDMWDFGYALTVHKAQGSQAPRVLVFEERFGRSSDADWRRWLYTAVTRAETELVIVGSGPG